MSFPPQNVIKHISDVMKMALRGNVHDFDTKLLNSPVIYVYLLLVGRQMRIKSMF